MEVIEEWPLLLKNCNFYKIKIQKKINQKFLSKKKQGLIYFDKPIGPTSCEILSWIKKKFDTKNVTSIGFLRAKISGCILVSIGNLLSFQKKNFEDKTNYILVYQKKITIKKLIKKKKNFPKNLFLLFRKKKQIELETIFHIFSSGKNRKKGIIEISIGLDEILNSVMISLGHFLEENLTYIEIRKIKEGNFCEEIGLVTFHDILDAVWLKKSFNKDFFLQKIISPLDTFLCNYRRVLIKNSSLRLVTFGGKPMKSGILKIEMNIEKNEKILIINTRGQPVALGTSKVNLNIFFQKNLGPVLEIRAILFSKKNSFEKWTSNSIRKKKRLLSDIGIEFFLKKRKFFSFRWWEKNLFFSLDQKIIKN